jgi:uncharacterized protein (TIGR03435 family)
MREMLRSLLADRFKLRVHRDTREGLTYALSLGRRRQRLHPPTSDAYAGIAVRVTVPPGDPVPVYIFEAHNASMQMLAQKLSVTLKRPVLDQTGLAGGYDFQVEFATDDLHLDSVPSVFNALDEVLGLRLDARKGPIDALVVDYAERASAN